MDTTSPDADLEQRWLPTPEQVTAGVAVLQTYPAEVRDRLLAVAVLVQPGKQVGFWETGQPVVAVPGIWVGFNGTGDDSRWTSYGETKQAAAKAGAAWLAHENLNGTVATVVIERDGHAAVFEEFEQF